MTRGEFEQMLGSLAKGWAERRYEDVAAQFADDVFYADPNSYALVDRQMLRRFFEDDGGYEQSCVFHNFVFNEGDQLGAAEYTYEGTYRYHGTVWVKIVDGKIASWREYQHRSEKHWNEFWQRARD